MFKGVMSSRRPRFGGTGGSRGIGWHAIGACGYDVLSLEWPIYRAGRRSGIGMLRLQSGDRVLDIGCGTGLNFAMLGAAVGRPARSSGWI
jgi:2-polyprenyl-3-methyl-5-hydroxy-6-metoxy-1,4-benzoquinol methylase